MLRRSTGKHTGACARQRPRSGARSQGLTHASRTLVQPAHRRPPGSVRRAPGQRLHPEHPLCNLFKTSAQPAVRESRGGATLTGGHHHQSLASESCLLRRMRHAPCSLALTSCRLSSWSWTSSSERALNSLYLKQRSVSPFFFFLKNANSQFCRHARVADLDGALRPLPGASPAAPRALDRGCLTSPFFLPPLPPPLPAAPAAAANRHAGCGRWQCADAWSLAISSSRRVDSARWACIDGGHALTCVSGAVCQCCRSLGGSRRRPSPVFPRSVASHPRVRGVLATGGASPKLEERGRADVFTCVSAHIVCGEA